MDTATIPMEALVSDPAENIYAYPGDVLTLVRLPQSFTVFGATGLNTQVNFTAERMTLVEALAKGGGLQDLRSDPGGVFCSGLSRPASSMPSAVHSCTPGPMDPRRSSIGST